MRQIRLIKPFIAIFSIILLIGCEPEETLPTQVGIQEVSPLSTLRPTAQIDTPPQPDPDPTPSATVTLETATALPTIATPTIAAATLTPLPTLEDEELELAVAELLANPMNCDVPCWWGAIPDITNIDEIKHTVSPYNFDIFEYDYKDDGELYTGLRLGIGWTEEYSDFEIRIGYTFSNSILTVVSAYTPSISEILARYGQPDEIWLYTIGFWPPESLPVQIIMVYFDEGMAVSYVADGDIQEDIVLGCFADEEMGRLSLITANSTTSHWDFPIIFDPVTQYLSLESATDLTMEDFMQRFSDPAQPQCIETPAELWE